MRIGLLRHFPVDEKYPAGWRTAADVEKIDQETPDVQADKTEQTPDLDNAENFQELAGKAIMEEVAAGKTVFRSGELDRKTVYLLEGQITLTDSTGRATNVTGGNDVAKHPLAGVDA